MKGFQSQLAKKMLKALGIPATPGHLKDKDLIHCINQYGGTVLNDLREKSALVTFFVLIDCNNRYDTAIEKIIELKTDLGFESVKPTKESTIETYRSRIANRYLDFKNLPDCAHRWKERTLKELEGINDE